MIGQQDKEVSVLGNGAVLRVEQEHYVHFIALDKVISISINKRLKECITEYPVTVGIFSSGDDGGHNLNLKTLESADELVRVFAHFKSCTS